MVKDHAAFIYAKQNYQSSEVCCVLSAAKHLVSDLLAYDVLGSVCYIL